MHSPETRALFIARARPRDLQMFGELLGARKVTRVID